MGLRSIVDALFTRLIEGPAPKGPGLPEQLRLQVRGNPFDSIAAAGVENRRKSNLIEIDLTEEARRLFDGMPYSEFLYYLASLDEVLTKREPTHRSSNPAAIVEEIQKGEPVYFAIDAYELGLLFGGKAGIRGKDRLWLVLEGGPEGTLRVRASTYRNQAIYS